MGSWFDFTRPSTTTLADVLADLRTLATTEISAATLIDAFRLLYDARGVFDACEYDFFSTAGFARDPQMRAAFEVFEAARAEVSARLNDPVVHTDIRRRLRIDAANWCAPHPTDEHEVVWCTLDAHLAGPLGPLLVPHLEFAQITTRKPHTWARSACVPASYVPGDLLVSTPMWLYRYTAALEHDPTPTLSPPFVLSGPVRDYLGGLWADDARDFQRLLEAACRLARVPVPLPLLPVSGRAR